MEAVELTKEEVMDLLIKALKQKKYDRYAKSFWLTIAMCPDFLEKCRLTIEGNGLVLEFEYPTNKFMANVIDPNQPPPTGFSYYDLREMYITLLDSIDPLLNVSVEHTLIPKALWDVLYSLASLVFTMKVGKGELNLLAPQTYYEDSKVILRLIQVSEEEAKEVIRDWLYQFCPHDQIESIKKELISEGLTTEDLRPNIRMNLLYEVIMLKGKRAYSEKSKPLYIRKCPYCGKEFSTQKMRNVFCSQSCASTFGSNLIRNNLQQEYNNLKQEYINSGMAPEEAVEKAVHEMIEKYPFLSKAKKKELGLPRRRTKKEIQQAKNQASQPPQEEELVVSKTLCKHRE
jgi:hypothetical protein